LTWRSGRLCYFKHKLQSGSEYGCIGSHAINSFHLSPGLRYQKNNDHRHRIKIEDLGAQQRPIPKSSSNIQKASEMASTHATDDGGLKANASDQASTQPVNVDFSQVQPTRSSLVAS